LKITMPNVESIFHEARLLAGDEREGYLKGACGNDLALRNKVEALLKADDEAGDFLRTNDGGDADATSAGVAPVGEKAKNAEAAGQTIDRYKLLQQIGEGGFGTVWMAEQKQPIKRRVALKIIKLGMDTKQVIARFEAERQALAMMDHPNIAKVFDAGATDTGRPYFVMELIRGIPILEYCDSERLSTQQRLGLFIQVCNAIQHAHQKGIIHRDIKPTNVLVTLHGDEPVVKVIDFGIAKATNTELTQKTFFTEHRQMIGTPAYMSPEQAVMSGLDIDTRSDVYSLGVLLYELLTGTTPFDQKDLLSKGFAEMMRIIREVEPHKPSTRLSTLGETGTRTAQLRRTDPKKLRTNLRGDLDWIVMKCLEKDRGRRYETANGLAQDIQRHLTGEPVVAAPPSRMYRVQKFVHRNKAQVIVSAVIAMLLVLGIIGTSMGMAWALSEKQRADLLARTEAAWRADAVAEAERAEAERQRADAERLIAEEARLEAEQARDIAESAQHKAEAERLRAEEATQRAIAEARTSQAITDFTLNLLSLANPDVSQSPNMTMLELLNHIGRDVGHMLKGQTRAEVAVRTAIAHAYHVMGHNHEAQIHLTRVFQLLDQLPETTPFDWHEPLLIRLFVEVDTAGAWSSAMYRYWRNVRDLAGELDPSVRPLLDEMYELTERFGEDERAIELIEQAIAEAEAADDQLMRLAIGSALHATGRVWQQQRRLELAARYLRAAVDIYRANYHDNHSHIARGLFNLADTYTVMGESERAVRILRDFIEQFGSFLSPDHAVVIQ
jgi:serine/threonine protein kinase/tetratricopeptide (TPR) repeat protein